MISDKLLELLTGPFIYALIFFIVGFIALLGTIKGIKTGTLKISDKSSSERTYKINKKNSQATFWANCIIYLIAETIVITISATVMFITVKELL